MSPLSIGIRRPQCKGDHSTYIDEVKNAWRFTSTSLMFLHGVLLKDWDKFPFIFIFIFYELHLQTSAILHHLNMVNMKAKRKGKGKVIPVL
jgi:hypothetical protein